MTTKIFLLILMAFSAQANIRGTVWMTEDLSEASLILTESGSPGELHRLYESMDLASSDIAQKYFELSNSRLVVACNDSRLIQKTSCRFTIRAGANDSEISTTVLKAWPKRIATIGMTENYSSELVDVFADTAPLQSLHIFIKASDGSILEIKGTMGAKMVIAFSGEI